ncbi:FUSC family protein [Aliiglaciecola lipolytica]|uniref:Integral membrane bound transporter domain-containing protein n=1 Tax=Aliiglaciecola lipolytica E3 TaxID=1127673 RepID=K6Y731_9ALTE|nr:FUSC family protein [Aliiglaciecola lipolytica]GAC14027.1 hypothetical protein GLIP_1386 [Aliiglaciecola lipolytica E3]
MYVTPAPTRKDDPYYALRLGLAGSLAYLAVAILAPALPPLIAALPIGLIAAQRKGFNAGKALAGPIAMIVMVYVMSTLIAFLRPMPGVYIIVMWLTYFTGYYMILKTGAQAGMLIIVVAVLMSVMGMHGNVILMSMRDGFVQASLVTLVIIPIVFFIFPPKTKEMHVDEPVPTNRNVTLNACIRATVLSGLSFYIYTVMEPSDMMLAVIAAMVIVFPTRYAMLYEAKQRVMATCFGCVAATACLFIFSITPHLVVILLLIFLMGIYFGTRMLDSQRPSMVYQYAFSVALALIAGSLSSQDASYAIYTRLLLTLAGALVAALTVALCDWLLAIYIEHRVETPPSVSKHEQT